MLSTDGAVVEEYNDRYRLIGVWSWNDLQSFMLLN